MASFSGFFKQKQKDKWFCAEVLQAEQ